MPRKKKVRYDEDGYPDQNVTESEVKDGDRYETRQHTEQKIRSITINPPTYDFNNGNQETRKQTQKPKAPKPGVRQIYPRPVKKDERLEQAITNDLRKRNIK